MPRKRSETVGYPTHSRAGPKKAASASKKPAQGRKPRGKAKAATEGSVAPGAAPKYMGGRPTDYKAEYADQVKKLCERGWTDVEMADFFGVTDRTFYNWMNAHDEFFQSVKLGKETPDDRTERSLYHRANGFEWYEEQAIKVKDVKYEAGKKVAETERVEVVKIKRKVPPDTPAAIFWMKNRRKDDWRDRQEFTGADGAALIPVLNVNYGAPSS